jgi:hypothetical protein
MHSEIGADRILRLHPAAPSVQDNVDSFSITYEPAQNRVQVLHQGTVHTGPYYSLDDFDSIEVNVFGGNDNINVNGTGGKPIVLNLGGDNDFVSLRGDIGAVTVDGGSGNDFAEFRDGGSYSNIENFIAPPDRFEPNESRADAENLGSAPTINETNLTLHTGHFTVDDDYYSFTSDITGKLNVRIDFLNSEANLGLTVYDSAGTVIGTSNGSGNQESVQIDANLSSKYYARVTSPTLPVSSTAHLPHYDLSVTALPTLSINDVKKNEGNSGLTAFTFTVERDGDTSGESSVDYATAYGNSETNSADLSAQSGTVTFASGEFSKPVTIYVKGDTTNEPDDVFFVNLSNSSGAQLGVSQGKGTIVNDDGSTSLPTLSINDVKKNEGNSGKTEFKFTVTRSGDTSGTSTVKYSTQFGNSQTSANDLTLKSGTLSFGANEKTKTITILVNGDTHKEVENVFYVNLSNASRATIKDGQGKGTIVNDDGLTLPSLSINDVRKNEGDSGKTQFKFTVTRSGNTSGTSSVKYATQYGNSLTDSHDLLPQSGTVSFASGEKTKTITILVNGDTDKGGENLFYVNLTSAKDATIADGRGKGTIVNDD